jgi:uncharacterized membrane protein YfcA
VPPLELLAPVLAVAFVAGLIQGLAGFGSALLAVPLMTLVLPVATVVPLMAVLGGLMSAYNLLHLHHAIRVRPVLRLLLGYLIGTPLGLLALTRAPEGLMLAGLGVFLCGYALLSLAGRQPAWAWLREWRLGLGVTSGALGAAFSTNGPPVILHVAAHREWGPDRQKALLAVFFTASSVITVAAHAAGGLIDGDVLRWVAWCLPLLLAGAQAGVMLYLRLGAHDYRRLTFLLILATGVMMLARVGGGVG